MNKKLQLGVIRGLVASGALCACSLATAAPITGDWVGGFSDTTNTTGPLTHGSLNINILTETADGANFDLTAVLNTVCIPPASGCGSQNVSLTGVLGANLGISLQNGDSTLLAIGSVASDYSRMGGTFTSYDNGALVISGNWSVVPISSVPEPTVTTLLVVGLGAMGVVVMRRRRAQ